MLHMGMFFGKLKNTILLIVLRHPVGTCILRVHLRGGSKKGPVAGLYLFWREARGVGSQKGENRSAQAQKLDGGQVLQFFGQTQGIA